MSSERPGENLNWSWAAICLCLCLWVSGTETNEVLFASAFRAFHDLAVRTDGIAASLAALAFSLAGHRVRVGLIACRVVLAPTAVIALKEQSLPFPLASLALAASLTLSAAWHVCESAELSSYACDILGTATPPPLLRLD